jgi:hypothetical protein
MFDQNGFKMFGITRLSDAKSRSICGENPDGAKGSAAQEVPDEKSPASMLGKGWKVKPCLILLKGSRTTVADIEGPGAITHIWMTSWPHAYRDLIIRMYWDGEDIPSVEVPFGDFFCCGHGLYARVNSMPIVANPKGALNSYWPMPFRKHARIEIENQQEKDLDCFFFQVDYELRDVDESEAYFHAQWRRSVTPIDNPEHVIVDSIKGKGHYVGTYLAWTQLSNGWWGEGEAKFFIDGDTEYPTICGTGTEDYFGGAWCFYDGPENRETTYNSNFLGYPLCVHKENQVIMHGLYRWHILDPIRFDNDLKVTIQALGWWPNGKFQPLQDDIASVAYWYQTEPHVKYPEMLPVHLRWPR